MRWNSQERTSCDGSKNPEELAEGGHQFPQWTSDTRRKLHFDFEGVKQQMLPATRSARIRSGSYPYSSPQRSTGTTELTLLLLSVLIYDREIQEMVMLEKDFPLFPPYPPYGGSAFARNIVLCLGLLALTKRLRLNPQTGDRLTGGY
jgi:hypothetical protein